MTNSAETDYRFATVDEALADIAAGKMVVVIDDEDRENEGDLLMAAEHVTPEAINFMAKHARGWICLALTPERCAELDLELMTAKNETPYETPFTVTIEAREGVTTGISAADRAQTIRVAVGTVTVLREHFHLQAAVDGDVGRGGLRERDRGCEGRHDCRREKFLFHSKSLLKSFEVVDADALRFAATQSSQN